MRNYLIPLLLLSAAIPAVASAEPGDNDRPRAERQERNRDGGGQQRERQDNGARSMQARPDFMRDRRGGMSDAAQQQQPPQTQQQPPRQMRMERSDQPQQQSPDFERQSRQADRAQRIEQQQRQLEQGGFARPERAPRGGGMTPNQAGSDVARSDGARIERNRGPRVITTDGLPSESGGFGTRARTERGEVFHRDQPARDSFAERLDRQQERNLARHVRGPGLPPGTASGAFPTSGNHGGGGLQSTPLPGGGEIRHSGSGSQWGTQWRGDRRYDWRDWRRRHHSSFHIGFYSDPFGFGYQRLGYGWQLFPSYYQSNYWLRDPWQYRLPPVYGPYRWVRYYDDALLVDTWSGEVVDVIYGFFW